MNTHSTAPGSSQTERYFHDLLLDVARLDPDIINETFSGEIAVCSILDSGAPGLSDEDILRFGLGSPRYELGPEAQQRLEEELDKTLLAMAEFFHADKWAHLTGDERNDLVWSLPTDIAGFKSSIASARSEAAATYARLETLMGTITKAHTRLRTDLTALLTTYAPSVNRRHAASDALLAARTEAALVKLSVVRARAQHALYGYRAADHDASVGQALERVYAGLRGEERGMRAEEGVVERQLGEYETVLGLVEGEGGGFRQVVEDWTRVRREREECLRDLRRLGWTGD